MKTLCIYLFSLFFTTNLFAYTVSGEAENAETGDPLEGFNIILTYPSGGIAAEAFTQTDGSFTISGVTDGTYNLEFYTYPDPIILNGDYFMNETFEDQIIVSGGNISGINFQIPPHHPDYTLTGVLYDAVTNDTITIQSFQAHAKLKYYVEFWYDNETENGIYVIENLPDWTYEFTLFENYYYEGVDLDITIDTLDPDTVKMDFYLQPKSGATVSGVLLDSVTNEPIKQAGRSIKLQTINSLFTETNDEGEFTFINVPPGTYSAIEATSQDTDYVNCTGSEISGFVVPEEGVSNVELFQKPWVSLHEVTADDYTFETGETKTITFSIVNDDLSYGSIWGINLIFPKGVTVQSTTPFYSNSGSAIVFEKIPECGTDKIKAWEGWHWIGVPQFSPAVGNLEVLNETAWADVTLQFSDSTMETAPVFYEIYYATHCYTIQPFSYGTIMMVNDNITGVSETEKFENRVNSFPNPASNQTNISLDLDKTRHGEIVVYDITGQAVLAPEQGIFHKGNTVTQINTSWLQEGIYYYTFEAEDIRLTGKLMISR